MTSAGRILFSSVPTLALNAPATTLDPEALTRVAATSTQLPAQGMLVSDIDTSGGCQPGAVLDLSVGDLRVLPFGVWRLGQRVLVNGVPTDQ